MYVIAFKILKHKENAEHTLDEVYKYEGLKMLAENNEYMEETVEALYVANADEIVRQQCRAREDAERRERTLERDNKKLKEELAGAKEENVRLKEEVERIAKLSKQLIAQGRIEELNRALSDKSVVERLYEELGIK